MTTSLHEEDSHHEVNDDIVEEDSHHEANYDIVEKGSHREVNDHIVEEDSHHEANDDIVEEDSQPEADDEIAKEDPHHEVIDDIVEGDSHHEANDDVVEDDSHHEANDEIVEYDPQIEAVLHAVEQAKEYLHNAGGALRKYADAVLDSEAAAVMVAKAVRKVEQTARMAADAIHKSTEAVREAEAVVHEAEVHLPRYGQVTSTIPDLRSSALFASRTPPDPIRPSNPEFFDEATGLLILRGPKSPSRLWTKPASRAFAELTEPENFAKALELEDAEFGNPDSLSVGGEDLMPEILERETDQTSQDKLPQSTQRPYRKSK